MITRFLLLSLLTLPLLAGYRKAAAGGKFLLLLSDDGAVWGIGGCTNGELAQDNCTYAAKPVRIPLPGPAREVGALEYTGFAVLENGELYSWGSNANGALGRAADDPDGRLRTVRSAPAPVPGLPPVQQLETRHKSIAAVTADGALYAWGWQFNQETVKAPVRVAGLPAIGPCTKPGRIHKLALAADGAIWAWGSNNRGQLGNGATTPSAVPAKLNLPAAVAIAACMECSLAVLADGTVRAWGRNDSSIAGNGENVQGQHFPTPVTVPGVTGAVAIRAGDGHVGAILKSGALRTWGHDGWGQSGSGSFGGYQPTAVTAKLTGVAELFYAPSSCYARTKDGRFWYWGFHRYRTAGALAKDKPVPTELLPLTL